VLAVGSYLAFKGREKRRPEPELRRRGGEPVFFERIYLQPKKTQESSPA